MKIYFDHEKLGSARASRGNAGPARTFGASPKRTFLGMGRFCGKLFISSEQKFAKSGATSPAREARALPNSIENEQDYEYELNHRRQAVLPANADRRRVACEAALKVEPG